MPNNNNKEEHHNIDILLSESDVFTGCTRATSQSMNMVDFVVADITAAPVVEESVRTKSQGRIEQALQASKQRGEAVLITYITGGYPTAQDTPDILLAMQEAGSDILELGVPFRNPIADGPTLQHCHNVAICGGTTCVRDCLQMVAVARARGLTTPVILMGYYNGFEQEPGGIDEICQEARAYEADGLLAIGIPEDEDEPYFYTTCFQNGLSGIPIVLPDSSEKRIDELVSFTSTFLYVVSVRGQTGARDALPEDLEDNVARVRRKTNLPLVVGFGISKPEMVHDVANIYDGAVIGSSITNHLNNAAADTTIDRARAIRYYVANLKTGAKQSDNPKPKNQASILCQVPTYVVD